MEELDGGETVDRHGASHSRSLVLGPFRYICTISGRGKTLECRVATRGSAARGRVLDDYIGLYARWDAHL